MKKIKNAVAYTQAIKTPGLDAKFIEAGAYSTHPDAVDTFDMDSASTDNLDTGNLAIVKLLPDAVSRELSGIVAPVNNMYARKTLINTYTETLIIKAGDVSSDEENRFLGATDYNLQAGRAVDIVYDFGATGWRIIANNDLSLT